jgi:3',5'-cyclic AMP phosphodiesterase CpdA
MHRVSGGDGGKFADFMGESRQMLRRTILALLLAGVCGAAENDFTFAIAGDRTGETVAGVWTRVWQQIAAEKPDFVVTVGDTIQGGNDATAEAEWIAVRPSWSRYHIPVYFTPGNHDIWSEKSRRIYEQQSGRRSFYSFNYQNAHFTILDNSESMQLSPRQMAFLQADLEANRARAPKFVFFHQPFWLIPIMLGNSDLPFHQMMRKYGVSYVVSGHVHRYLRTELDGIVYLLAGSSGGHLRGHDPAKGVEQGWLFMHLLVKVQGTKVEATVKEEAPR